MKTLNTLLLAGTALALASPALAETMITTTTTPATANAEIIAPPTAVKVDTKTDVVTDKTYNHEGEVVSTTTTKTTTDTYKFDTNSNGILDEDEYVTYSYHVIDYDRDGRVNNTEWNKYTTFWYEPYKVEMDPEVTTFVSYDVDGDGFIDTAEYSKAYDMNIYHAWDMDKSGSVDMVEYKSMTTTYHDLDKDGVYDWVTSESNHSH